MSFPATAFDWEGERLSDDEWSLSCDRCPRRGTFSGPIYKIVDHPEDEGWEMIGGEAVCPLCLEEESQKKESK